MYELARLLGSSVRMIEHRYGALLDTAHDAILERLDAVNSRASYDGPRQNALL